MIRNASTKSREPKSLTLEEAYAKAATYCAKAERSEHKVRNKLYTWQVEPAYHDAVIDRLRSNRYIDDARFALSFARDKHRFSAWGRERIRHELSLHRIDSETINITLDEVFEEFDEEEQLMNVLSKKQRQLKSSDSRRKHFEQMMRYAAYRGYAYEKARRAVERLLSYDADE